MWTLLSPASSDQVNKETKQCPRLTNASSTSLLWSHLALFIKSLRNFCVFKYCAQLIYLYVNQQWLSWLTAVCVGMAVCRCGDGVQCRGWEGASPAHWTSLWTAEYTRRSVITHLLAYFGLHYKDCIQDVSISCEIGFENICDFILERLKSWQTSYLLTDSFQ